MAKKIAGHFFVLISALFIVFLLQSIAIKAQAIPPIPPIVTDIPTLQDASHNFTDLNFKKAVWEWLGHSGEPGSFTHYDIQQRIGSMYYELDVGSKNISNLNGLEYFEGLVILGCGDNKLTALPALPSTLTVLYCSDNKLTNLPDMPINLKLLDCSNNKLTGLPSLPFGLKELYCHNNRLASLPQLPDLTELSCQNNELAEINIPGSMRYLYCDNNKLVRLPQLPNGLEQLSCKSNRLARLPAIPGSLKSIYVSDNCLMELPSIPDTVQRFEVEYNYLDVFRNPLLTSLNKPNYIFKPQCKIKYEGTDALEIEEGKSVFINNIKRQMSTDGNVWGNLSDVPLSDLTFTSNNNNVVKVDSTGLITGVSAGTTQINSLLYGIDSQQTKAVISIKVIPATSQQSTLYGEASGFAIPFLDQASELGIFTDRLRGQSMLLPITREEFAELSVKFYEKVTGKTALIPTDKTFTDCRNPEILKAYGLKITYGTGDGTKFEPAVTLSRQQMAAMIERTLKACYPNLVIDTYNQPDFKDQRDFADYAITPAKFMAKYSITVGDGRGNFTPKGDCLRQHSIMFLIKAYNCRGNYIYE